MNKIITHVNLDDVRKIKQQIVESDITFLTNDLFVAIVGLKEIGGVIDCMFGKENVVIISITEPGTDPLSSRIENIFSGFSDVLEIQFWDILAEFDDYTLIQKEQGLVIRDFIKKNSDKKFLIHCKAGISRSAGVASAVECIIKFDGDVERYSCVKPLDGFWRYIPNKAVFDTILNSAN